MAVQTITVTYQEPEFQDMLSKCLSGIIKSEISGIINSAEPLKEILTRQETADFLNLSLQTLHEYTKKGIVKSHRIGNSVRYKREDILQSLTEIRFRR